ncbi:MAG: hypothetical protein ACI4S3_06085 [Candidatus Gastranaerophilaceae bacterium]
MVSFPATQNYTYSNFRGIRTRNGVNTNGSISAVVCQNVDFIPNTVGSDIQIKSTKGNVLYAQYPDFNIIKGFETVQDGVRYFLVYAENDEKGILLRYVTYDDTFEIIIDDLQVTGEANGITMNDTAYDVFVFTNGKDYYSVNFAITPITQVINPVYKEEQLTGLSLCEKDGALVIGSDNLSLVMGSRQGDIYDWDYVVTADDTTKPWFYPFGKSVTAVIPYIDGLLVFTKDDSTMLKGNPADLTTFEKLDASIGGCMSYESWCYHDKYLFFYDNVQKNIYYYMQNDIGQKVLGEPIAPEVQKYFTKDIKRVQIMPYVGENRNEIWILTDKFKLIYDYFIGEWSERVCQDINSYFIYDNAIYSTTPDGKILKEKEGIDSCKFDDVFYPAVYTMQTINLGSYSNMKEMEMQPLFTVSDDNDNMFIIDCVIDGKKTKTKKVQLIVNGGIWGDDTDELIPESTFDVAIFSSGSEHVTHQLKGKFVSNWYYLQFTIRTEELGQEFNILAMELKGITQETDTTGRK